MPGTAAKIIISERQQKLLEEFSKSRTISKCVSQRAMIILLGFAGLFNEEIALQVDLNRMQVGVWRQRWRDAWDALSRAVQSYSDSLWESQSLAEAGEEE